MTAPIGTGPVSRQEALFGRWPWTTVRFLLPVLLLLLPAASRGQEGLSTLRGTVTDPSGGVMPGVEVTVEEVATGITLRKVITDNQGNYEVGYGKPPRHTRFQKGRSGNPAGRPRGKKNLATLLSDALDQKIIVVESGRRKKISKREAIVTQLVNKSASADLKATQILLAMLRDVETRADSGCADIGSLTEADRQIIQRIQARIRREQG